MKEDLWYVYEFDNCSCDDCGRLASCAVYRKDKTDMFAQICGNCDEAWRKNEGLTYGD